MTNRKAITLILAAALLLPVTVWAGDDTWQAASSGYFSKDSSWTDGSVPTAGDTVGFDVAGTYQVWWNSFTGDWTTQSMALSGGDVTFRISDSAGSPYVWTITDGGPKADATITGGTLTLGLAGYTGNLILDIDDALKVDGDGTLNVIMGNEARCNATTVGSTGTGSLAIASGGSISNSTGLVGHYSASTGTVTVDGGTWANASTLYVGLWGDGQLTIEGGGGVSNSSGYVGRYSGSTGTVTVTGEDSAWQSSGNLYLGGTDTTDGGDASLDLTGGGRVCVGDINPATVGLDSALSALVVSDDDTTGGELVVRNGATIDNDGYVYLGYHAGETGAATVTGAGSSWTNDSILYVGYSGEGELTIAGGGSVSNSTGYLGYSTGSTGTITVDGGIWTNASNLFVGRYGEGELTIENGGGVSNSDSYVGRYTGSTGTVTVDGGTWTNTSTLYVGYYGEGELAIAGGGGVSNSDGYVGRWSGSTGTVTVTGEDSTWQSFGNLCLGGTDTADGGDASLDLAGGGRVCVGDIDPASVALNSSLSAVVVSDDDAGGGELVVRNSATLTNDFKAYLGYNAGETGAATVTGTGSSWTNDSTLYVGYYGEGELTIESGGGVSNDNGYISRQSGSTGTVTVDGGTWTNGSTLYVGLWGDGELTIEGGGGVSNSSGYLGRYSGSTGMVTVTGEDSAWQSFRNLILGGTDTADGGDASLDLATGGRVYVGDIDPATVLLDPSQSAVVVSDDFPVGGELLLRNGATLANDYMAYLGYNAGETGAATVTGTGTSWTNDSTLYVGYSGEGELTIAGGGGVSNNSTSVGGHSGSTGTVTVDGGTWTNDLTLSVGRFGEGELTIENGGSVSNGEGRVASGSDSTGTVTIDGGTWANSNDLCVGGSSIDPGGTGIVTVLAGGLLEVGDTLRIWPDGTVNLAGGTVRFGVADPLDDQGGTLNYYAGTVKFDCDVTVLAGMSGVTDFFGSPPTIPAGKHLDVRGKATLIQPVTLSGGTFTTESIQNGTLLDLQSGTFNLTASDLAIGTTGQLGPTLALGPGVTVNLTQTATVDPTGLLHLAGGAFTAGAFVNQGQTVLEGVGASLTATTFTNEHVLAGNGLVNAALQNEASGRVEVASGQHLVFAEPGNTNAGEIKLLGGIVEFAEDLTNAATGFISGRGVLDVAAGLTNQGAVALSGGFTDIYGDVTNDPAGQIVISGGSTTTFYDDVASDGEIRVSAGCSAVFFGAFTGTGGTTGSGTVYLEGDLKPGSSPGAVSFGGDVALGSAASVEVEIAGPTAGAEYDHVNVTGQMTLGGTLAVDLVNPYRPSHNDAFQVMTFASRGGTTFDTHEGLDLGDRLALVPTYGTTNLVLTAVQGGPGEWAIDADGDASAPDNWSAGLPNGVGDVATFGSVITVAREVTVDVPTVLGEIVFNSAQAYALAGPNPLTFETDAGAAAIAVADVAATHVIAADVLLADALDIDVAALGTLVIEGLLDNSAGQTITKTGAGTLVIDGPQVHAPGTFFDILGGTVDLNTAAGGAGTVNLSVLVDDAVLHFGCDQYLDTLALQNGALVRFTGANVVVLKHLVMDGIGFGAMTLTPEPATLALLAAGLGALVLRKRRT